MPNGEDRDRQGGQNEYQSNIYGGSQDVSTPASGGTTSYGMESLSMESFFDDNGRPLPLEQIVALIKKQKPDVNETVIRNQVKDFMPKLQKISEEEKGFLGKEKGIAARERGLAMEKAEDVYGLTTKGAQRGLQSSLGQAQQQAGQLGGQMRGAYGGMGGGMRGAMGGQKALAKGVESTYGGYQDKMIGAQQQRGYAEEQFGVGGIGEARADLGFEKGMYGLGQEKEKEFERDIGTFLEGFRGGGRVPSKESFSYLLQSLPEAGGS